MLKLAVVGAGIMGVNHVRVARQLPGARVAFVVDRDEERARRTANVVGAEPLGSVEDLPDDVDGAVVALPTHLHAQVGEQLAKRGIHLLIEKPLAADMFEAQRLVEVARENDVILQVGHVERFNPAVMELQRLIDGPVHFDIARISPYSPRVNDGVILDLMIHDLDLVLAMAGAPVVEAAATGTAVRSASEDLAVALLTFENGVTATVTASRIGQQKIRTMEVTQTENYVTVDLVRQDVTVNRVHHVEYFSEEGARYRQTGMVEVPFLENRGEPLYLELLDFVTAIREGGAPRVSGDDGARALELALRLTDLANRK